MKFERYSSPKWMLLSGVVFLLSFGGCSGGGGGGSSSARFSFSPDTLHFVAETPAAPTEGSRLVTASVDRNLEGVLYLVTSIEGDAVTGFNNFVVNPGGLSASTLLDIATPSDLGTGVHAGRLTIRACLNSPNCSSGELSGSPQTVDVTYEIKSSVRADTMMPSTGVANQAGWVVLRGPGIANVNTITFGSSAARSVVVVSDNEIHAEHDALPPGTYEVKLEDALGGVPFDADLKVVAASAYPAASLAYPAVIEEVLEVVFDVEREALLVAVELADRNDNQVLRYQFAGGSFTSLTTLDCRWCGIWLSRPTVVN